MADLSFEPDRQSLESILADCHSGVIQIPEFQREWVWDEDRIVSLLDSVLREFPIGTLMTLDTDANIKFKPRPISGRVGNKKLKKPKYLLLDGQQRMTSLYHAILSKKPTMTQDAKGREIERWFYIDIKKCLESESYSQGVVVSVAKNKSHKKYNKEIIIPDLKTEEREYESFMFPISKIFDFTDWMYGFEDYWAEKNGGKIDKDIRNIFRNFHEKILRNIPSYDVPIILLNKAVSREAVCVIFEKVNTGGKSLDAFELVTAMYAAENHNLRKDWYGDEDEGIIGREQRFSEYLRRHGSEESILADVSNTDFLQAISLMHTRNLAREHKRENRKSHAVSGERRALLDLPLSAYRKYEKKAEKGFMWAAKFIHKHNIYRSKDLPYQSQVISLAVILSDIGSDWQQKEILDKLNRWYWRGIFGELYSSSSETQLARDVVDVPTWINGGDEPPSIRDASFKSERLMSSRMKNSAVYKGVNALLMKHGAKDFRTGQDFSESIFFKEDVNVHHIFPIAWCKNNDIGRSEYDSIINKTPISYRTNVILGGDAPSQYLAQLEIGNRNIRAVKKENIDEYIESHLINPKLLREDNFKKFISDRKKRLIALIKKCTED